MLRNMTAKYGEKYTDPQSVAEIPKFVYVLWCFPARVPWLILCLFCSAQHKLNVDEILEPISSFKNFNEFFYRKLKPDARPVAFSNDPVCSFLTCNDFVFWPPSQLALRISASVVPVRLPYFPLCRTWL